MKGMFMHLCEYCGADVPDGAGFCGKCGRVASNAQPQQPLRYSPMNEPTHQVGAQSDAPYPPQRLTRKPYQYNPLPPDPQPYSPMANQPVARYQQGNPPPSSWQQTPPSPVPPNGQPYPAQPPLVIGSAPSRPKGGAK